VVDGDCEKISVVKTIITSKANKYLLPEWKKVIIEILVIGG
jgi:hypothetical protein